MHGATALDQEDIAAVQHAVRQRGLRLFELRGLLAPEKLAESSDSRVEGDQVGPA